MSKLKSGRMKVKTLSDGYPWLSLPITTPRNARLVVFGDADFASDAFFAQYGNGDFLINAIDWASQQEDLISLTPKDNIVRMMVAPQAITMNLILFGSVFFLPGGSYYPVYLSGSNAAGEGNLP
jgi:hypothetical protein